MFNKNAVLQPSQLTEVFESAFPLCNWQNQIPVATVLPMTLCDIKRKVSCEEKRPVDSDSWGPMKQPYVDGFSRPIRSGDHPLSLGSCYFCIIFLFVMISMKIFESYRID